MSLHPHRSRTGAVANRPVLAPHLQETIESLAAGETMREMAARLFISTNTVKSRLKSLYQQLGARDQAHAVAIAFRLGVLPAGGEAAPERDVQPVVVAGLNQERLRATIAELTALLRIAERNVGAGSPATDGHQHLLRRIGEIARSGAAEPTSDPWATLERIAAITEAAGTAELSADDLILLLTS
ncbi:helix-turn-helix transcriptional regulator [Actinoplanes sp. NPDC051851]|uniref:helix-turn-helix transcriptional regulator n=1 Tax=Actinoplanes sp. NPDC051851 TaxID=3154753 RepID=UPI0034174099